MASIATLGLLTTDTSLNPRADKSPTVDDFTIVPLSRTFSPWLTSRPAILISLPSVTLVRIPIECSGPLKLVIDSVVSSKGTTASAPAGIGAPVIILEALPALISIVGSEPAETVSKTSR